MTDEQHIPGESAPVPAEPITAPPPDFAQKILDSIPVPNTAPPVQQPVLNNTPPPENMGDTMAYGATMPYQPIPNDGPTVIYTSQQPNGYAPQAYPQQQPADSTMTFNAPPPGYYPPPPPPPQQPIAQPEPIGPQPPKNSGRKMKGWVLALIISGAVLLLAGLATGAFFLIDALTHRNVDLAQLYSIQVEGFDGYAEAHIERGEWDALEVFGSTERAYLAPTLDVTLDKTENIANGDVLTATVTYDEVYAERVGIRFQNTTFTLTVEGLEEAEIIDPFEGVFLNTEGVAPVGTVTIEGGNTDLFYYYIDGDQRYFKNGDVVTLAVTYNEEDIKAAGGVVLNDRADFEISGLPEYITSAEQLSERTNLLISESTGSKMADRLADNSYSIIYEIDSEDLSFLADVSVKDVTLEKTYITYRKEPRDWGRFNSVHHLYSMKVILSQDGKSETFTMYALSTAHNIILETDGSLRPLDGDVEFYMASCFDADAQYLYDQNIGSLSEDYAIIEVK